MSREKLNIKRGKGDHLDSLTGILKHVKKTSVELQHEAWKGIVKKQMKILNIDET